MKSVEKVTNQRGASRRESHSETFKAKVLNEPLCTDKPEYAVAEHFIINQTMVSNS